nr:MAG TPA: NTP-PPase-like protein [Caudoviricetes sp.]
MTTNEIQTKMNYYELAKEIHANAVAKGFWDEPHSLNHHFMLAITEVSEAVEAHRKGRTASVPDGIEDFPDKAFIPSFESHIKDTLEDELADTQIRLLDIYGSIIEKKEDTPDITEEVKENYPFARGFVEPLEEFTEWAFILTNDLSCNPIAQTTLLKVYNGICTLLCMAEHFGIDLERHVRLKMRYNATRPRLHGKMY